MKAAILYHSADLDGALSGVIANYYLSQRCEEVKHFGYDYHHKIPLNTLEGFDEIYVIDFSNDELFNSHLSNKIIWIDHHKTAMEKGYKVKTFAIDGVAACRLALQFFTNINYSILDRKAFFDREVQEPLFVTLAGEYDIWDETSPAARPLNFGIADISFKNIDRMFRATKSILTGGKKNSDESRIEELCEARQIEGWDATILRDSIKKGYGVIDYINATSSKIPENHILIDGKVGRVINTSIFSSLIHKLKPEEDFIMVWQHQGNNRVKISFYSDKIDISGFAKRYGGGGHRGAAGAYVDLLTLGSIIFK